MNRLEVLGVGAADLVPPERPVLGLILGGKARTRGDGPPQALLCLLQGLSPHLGTPPDSLGEDPPGRTEGLQ